MKLTAIIIICYRTVSLFQIEISVINYGMQPSLLIVYGEKVFALRSILDYLRITFLSFYFYNDTNIKLQISLYI